MRGAFARPSPPIRRSPDDAAAAHVSTDPAMTRHAGGRKHGSGGNTDFRRDAGLPIG